MLDTGSEQFLKLDRHDLKRDDPDWIAACLSEPTTKVIASWRYRFPVSDGFVSPMSVAEISALTDASVEYYFLGEEASSGSYFFAAQIAEPSQPLDDWLSIRHLQNNEPLTEILLFAQGLLNWHRDCSFCETCASPLQVASGGAKKLCASPDCNKEVFPRINPAIIVLLLHQDRCLLANSKRFQGDIPMYSCIAGFSETGETFEQTLHREVYEEVGLRVTETRYLCNQPWPFPSSFMVGFHAFTHDTKVTYHDGEINDARWFNRAELKQAVEAGIIQLSSQKSISFTLLADWYNSGSDHRLEQIQRV